VNTKKLRVSGTTNNFEDENSVEISFADFREWTALIPAAHGILSTILVQRTVEALGVDCNINQVCVVQIDVSHFISFNYSLGAEVMNESPYRDIACRRN
jgi:hypothetical protein